MKTIYKQMLLYLLLGIGCFECGIFKCYLETNFIFLKFTACGLGLLLATIYFDMVIFLFESKNENNIIAKTNNKILNCLITIKNFITYRFFIGIDVCISYYLGCYIGNLLMK
jgi:hypothetical protein